MAAADLSKVLKASSPRIYKDQLVGVIGLFKRHQPIDPVLLGKLCQRPRLTATMVRDFLQAYQDNPQRLDADQLKAQPAPSANSQLEAYRTLTEQEADRVYH